MAGEWSEVELSRIAKLRSGFPFKSASWLETGVPVIKISNVKDGRIVSEGCGYVSEETASSASDWMTKDGDVLLAMTGYVGETALVRSGEEFLINQRVGRFEFLPNSPVIAPFLFFFLRQPAVRAQIEMLARGSAQPNLSAGDAARLLIPAPPLPEQRAITHILGTLDDKIELNRRRNQTLEAMACALFQDWFVDFGPVRAKMAGQKRYLPEDIWQIFPDHLDDEGKPDGWAIAALDALAALVTTSVSPGRSPETVFEHYSIPAYDAGRMPAMELGASIKSNKYVVDADSVLVSKLNPQTPRIWLPHVATVHAICSTEFMQFVPHDRGNRPYLYCLMSSKAMQGEVLKHVTGSTGSRQRAQPPQISKTEVHEPHADILKAFNLQAAPILNAVADNQCESLSLAQLRDTLLPKLISGEVRVADAEEFMERVEHWTSTNRTRNAP